jgi:uridylate kinase
MYFGNKKRENMSYKPVYKRILLKISGEALKGTENFGYASDSLKDLVKNLSKVVTSGIELGLVVGAGNIWRGKIGKKIGMDPVKADYMGMLGTVMNALIIKDCFETNGIECKIQTTLQMSPVTEPFDHEKAIKDLQKRRVVIFAGGTGHPFFTTDTTAALRALEINAEAVLKATKVDGIYSEDPQINPSAKRYSTLSYNEALIKDLKIMDSTAFSLCKDHNLPIIVFNFSDPNNLQKVLEGNTSMATVVSDN